MLETGTWRCGDAQEFVKEYQWLFDIHPTHLFRHKDLLARLELEFGCDVDICGLIDAVTQPRVSDGKLNNFISKCHQLTLFHNQIMECDGKMKPVKGVPEKKAYEVHKLAPIITAIAKELKLCHFVDIGAGQGYLDFALLDCQPEFVITAVERERAQLVGLARRRSFKDRMHITELDVNTHTTIGAFQRTISWHHDYVMFSLHSCGSLSDHMCRLFVEDPRARALVCVGCCHNLITSPSFPQSRRYSQSGTTLNAQQLMAACQVPMRWAVDRESVQLTELKNYYRGLLEALVCSRGTELGSIGRLKVDVGKTTFREYCQMVPDFMVSEQQVLLVEQQNEQYRKHLQVYWTVRACIGQVIESLIQMDRVYKLQEMLPQARISVVPVFSVRHSPRRFAITAVK